MTNSKSRQARLIQPANPAKGLPPKSVLDLTVHTSVEALDMPQLKHFKLWMATGNFTLLWGLNLLMFGLLNLTSPIFQENTLILLNLTLAAGLSTVLRYFNLAECRYSLGKACLLSTCLWLMNGLALTLLGQFSLTRMAICGGIFALYALMSGSLQYWLGRPHSRKNTKSFYYHLELGIKRAIDLTSSLIGLLFLSPLLALVAMIICLESKGSLIYIQTRIGLNEKKFLMYKFRSMIVNAEKLELVHRQMLYKHNDDPRITWFGRLIRKLSIDELPQLWNVVTGDMSLVGPRPPIEREYEMMNYNHKRKFEAKPGLTGLWQIQGRVRNERDFNSVAAYDVTYLENWCLMEDLRILLATIPVVLLQKGAC